MNNPILLIFELLATLLVLIPLNGLLINSLGYLGQRLKFSREFIIVLIVGFAVSLPELLITINSWFFGQPELALGNAIGSGIVMISLVTGIFAIFNKNFRTNKIFSSNQLVFMSLSATLNIILALDGTISRVDGAILLIVYGIYIYTLVNHKNNFSIESHLKFQKQKTVLNIIVFVLALAGASIAAYFVNSISREIFINSAFPLFFIGLIIVAPFGAIPELLFELQLSNKGKSSLALSELFTSLVTNTTLIIGLTALVNPFNITTNILYYFAALYFVVLLAIFNVLVHSKNELDWKEGLLLLLSFLVFIISSMILVFQ